MEIDYLVEVEGGRVPLFWSVLRGAVAVLILVLSLSLYLAGILLTLTIIGALVGIPIIVATYAMDAVALTVLINIRERVHRVKCPRCGRKRWTLPAVKGLFRCKGCGAVVRVVSCEEEATGAPGDRSASG